jgi:hypothetical protein
LLLARLRHELSISRRGGQPIISLVEEAVPVAVVAGASTPLTDAAAAELLFALPSGTLPDAVRGAQLDWLSGQTTALQGALTNVARRRAEELLSDHRRVRDAAKAKGTYDIRAMEPVDVIGAWVLLPVAR